LEPRGPAHLAAEARPYQRLLREAIEKGTLKRADPPEQSTGEEPHWEPPRETTPIRRPDLFAYVRKNRIKNAFIAV
jgi:hypothetical protein